MAIDGNTIDDPGSVNKQNSLAGDNSSLLVDSGLLNQTSNDRTANTFTVAQAGENSGGGLFKSLTDAFTSIWTSSDSSKRTPENLPENEKSSLARFYEQYRLGDPSNTRINDLTFSLINGDLNRIATMLSRGPEAGSVLKKVLENSGMIALYRPEENYLRIGHRQISATGNDIVSYLNIKVDPKSGEAKFEADFVGQQSRGKFKNQQEYISDFGKFISHQVSQRMLSPQWNPTQAQAYTDLIKKLRTPEGQAPK